MSTIESAAASLGAASTGQNRTRSEEDFDSLVGTREDFLTILLAQLKFQDPLDPMEGTEFIDSITRLSSVEQSINQNAHLEEIESLLKAERNNFGSPVSYLDKEIEFNSPAINLVNGQAEFSYNIDEKPDDVFIVIRDVNGNVIRRSSGEKVTGENTIIWDGKDSAGNPVPDGEYFASVDYAIGEGEEAVIKSVDTSTKGVVTGANFEGNEVILLVGNIKTTVGDIIAIRSKDQEDI